MDRILFVSVSQLTYEMDGLALASGAGRFCPKDSFRNGTS